VQEQQQEQNCSTQQIEKYKNCNCTDNRKFLTLQLPLVNTDTSFIFQYLTEFKYDYRMTTFVILDLGFKALKRHSTAIEKSSRVSERRVAVLPRILAR